MSFHVGIEVTGADSSLEVPFLRDREAGRWGQKERLGGGGRH